MYQNDIWRDLTTFVHQAVDGRLDLLNEGMLVHRSDALLASLPSISRSKLATTGVLLGRYHTVLHKELCHAQEPRTLPATVEAELRELTRAVLMTIGVGEGVSVEAAVGVALVLYKRGVTAFCA